MGRATWVERESGRWRCGSFLRRAPWSGAARPRPRSARTARARGRSRAGCDRGSPRACATRPAAARRSRRAGTAGSARPPRASGARLREHRVLVPALLLDPSASVGHQLARVGGRHHHGAVPTRGQLVGEALHETVDLVVQSPRIGGHLRDAQWVGGHEWGRIRGRERTTGGPRRPPVRSAQWPEGLRGRFDLDARLSARELRRSRVLRR